MTEPKVQWTTGALTDDLMKKLRLDRMLAVTEATLRDATGQRADVVAMRRTLADSPLLIIEIKTARSDLLGDLRRGKWRGYLNDGAVAFAFPEGLAKVHEIPPEAGVIVRSGNGWRWRRSPVWSEAPRPTPYLYRRFILTVADQVAIRTAALHRPKARGLYEAALRTGKETGRRLAQIAADVETWTKLAEEKKSVYEEQIDLVEKLRVEIGNLRSERARLHREIAA